MENSSSNEYGSIACKKKMVFGELLRFWEEGEAENLSFRNLFEDTVMLLAASSFANVLLFPMVSSTHYVHI